MSLHTFLWHVIRFCIIYMITFFLYRITLNGLVSREEQLLKLILYSLYLHLILCTHSLCSSYLLLACLYPPVMPCAMRALPLVLIWDRIYHLLQVVEVYLVSHWSSPLVLLLILLLVPGDIKIVNIIMSDLLSNLIFFPYLPSQQLPQGIDMLNLVLEDQRVSLLLLMDVQEGEELFLNVPSHSNYLWSLLLALLLPPLFLQNNLVSLFALHVGTSLSLSLFISGFKLAVDQKVVARWKDGNWYAATIREVSPIKAYLEFYDGDHSSVSVQNILPLVSAQTE